MTAAHAIPGSFLLAILGGAMALNALMLVAIVAAKFLRNCREVVRGRIRERMTEYFLHVVESDAPLQVKGRRIGSGSNSLCLPAPRTFAGAATRETILAFMMTLRGERRTRLTHILESAGYVKAMIRQLQSRSELRRARAASTLGAMRSPRAAACLTEHFLHDPAQEVRIVAAEALSMLRHIAGIPGALLFMEAVRQPSRYQEARIANVLVSFGATVVPDLEAALSDPEQRIVLFALDVLIEIGTVLHPARILQAAVHPSVHVRGRAIELIGAAGISDGFAVLLQAVSDCEPYVRVNAVRALFALGAPSEGDERISYFQVLEGALSDERWTVRRNAAAALAGAGDAGHAVLQRVLSPESLVALQFHDLRRARLAPSVA
jgi:HEAT repeat protein